MREIIQENIFLPYSKNNRGKADLSPKNQESLVGE